MLYLVTQWDWQVLFCQTSCELEDLPMCRILYFCRLNLLRFLSVPFSSPLRSLWREIPLWCHSYSSQFSLQTFCLIIQIFTEQGKEDQIQYLPLGFSTRHCTPTAFGAAAAPFKPSQVAFNSAHTSHCLFTVHFDIPTKGSC